MSTRSYIGIADDDIRFIYCHFDGYPCGVGKILLHHYESKEKVEELISLGAISYLAKYVAPVNENSTHSFDDPDDDVTVAYHRDRGEERNSPNTAHSKIAFHRAANKCCVDYCYLFENGAWYYINAWKEPSDKTEWIELTERICQDDSL